MSIMVFFVLTQLSEQDRIIEERQDELPATATGIYEEIKRGVGLFDELVFTAIMLTSLLTEFESF